MEEWAFHQFHQLISYLCSFFRKSFLFYGNFHNIEEAALDSTNLALDVSTICATLCSINLVDWENNWKILLEERIAFHHINKSISHLSSIDGGLFSCRSRLKSLKQRTICPTKPKFESNSDCFYSKWFYSTFFDNNNCVYVCLISFFYIIKCFLSFIYLVCFCFVVCLRILCVFFFCNSCLCIKYLMSIG